MTISRRRRVPNQAQLFPAQSVAQVKPFLKWAGGKSRLLPILRQYLPDRGFRRYIEPFLGGGAFFFDTAPHSAILGDANPELISCYEAVRDVPDEVIRALLRMRVSESEFYAIRSQNPAGLPPAVRAARFIYLNKTCYNGLYRVNKKGEFNTPFGKYAEETSLIDAENLQAASRLLRQAHLICGDYRSIVALAEPEDFVYLDPPYLPVSKYSDFKRYTKEFFYASDHETLASVFASLAAKGCYVLLSNSFHPTISALYSRFFTRTVAVPRFVNCKGTGRGNIMELLISNRCPGAENVRE